MVETVGTGQQEVEIINHSHTVVVVLVPGMGDEIQAIKAGILEIADVLVVNTCAFIDSAKQESIDAILGNPGIAAYSAAKGGVLPLTMLVNGISVGDIDSRRQRLIAKAFGFRLHLVERPIVPPQN